ncbi:MAG: lactate racemase domain-containing protein [Desulfitobacterium hafniense]|nr:lactate racemase domain-containing protein [Desulfitobacterium hafniense]
MHETVFPRMVRVKQHFNHPQIVDIDAEVRSEVRRILPGTKVCPGDSVAITVGSRGIANLAKIVFALASELKNFGCRVFLVPAMGSHGGATAEGQLKVLEHYGITEASMGVPIKSCMDVTEVTKTEDGLSVFVDQNALGADHIVAFNRIKPHTDFRGEVESGLLKIMTIGLGKHRGATYYHQAAVKLGGSRMIRTVGRSVIRACPVAFGLGVVENANDQTAIITAMLPHEIESQEEALLIRAKELMAKLPFQELDILIVDRIGKNISGTGMDTNVIGRIMNIYTKDPEWPKITRIFVRDLTEETDGNAIGIGMADFTTKRLTEKINYKVTYTNSLTGLVPEKARIPITCENDHEALDTALKTIGLVPPEQAKVIWIQDTLALTEVYVSEVYLPEVQDNPGLQLLGQPEGLSFDSSGNLVSKW